MNTYYAYNTQSTQSVSETLTITNGQVQLRHIPRQSSVTIPGFMETTALVVPAGRFRVDYFDSNGEYREASRRIFFNAADNGKIISVGYNAVGTPVTAADMNEIKAHMANSTLHGSGTHPITPAQVQQVVAHMANTSIHSSNGFCYVGAYNDYDDFYYNYNGDIIDRISYFNIAENRMYVYIGSIGEFRPFNPGGGAGVKLNHKHIINYENVDEDVSNQSWVFYYQGENSYWVTVPNTFANTYEMDSSHHKYRVFKAKLCYEDGTELPAWGWDDDESLLPPNAYRQYEWIDSYDVNNFDAIDVFQIYDYNGRPMYVHWTTDENGNVIDYDETVDYEE